MRFAVAGLGLLFGTGGLLGCKDDTSSDGGVAMAPVRADSGSPQEAARATFFVTSDTSATGNLGGLAGADARCERLATAAGLSKKGWAAYLSVEHEPATGAAVHARDRIGSGPWYNVRGVELAADLDALHARKGDADVFLSEKGEKIAGQWPDSPKPVEHDILTGSDPQGHVIAGQTCADWTSESAELMAMVGHSDGLGPGGDGSGPYASWNSSHANGGCNDTAPRGGAGRLYCFAP